MELNLTNISNRTWAKENNRLWISGEVILLTITMFTVYVFISLLYYNWRLRNAVGVSGNIVERRERYLRYSCSAAIFMAIVRCSLHQSILWLTNYDDIVTCRNMLAASKTFYNISISLMYVYLWLRQRNYYKSIELEPLRNRWVDIFDWSIFVMIIMTSSVMAIIAYVPAIGEQQMTYHKDRCNVFEISSKIIMRVYAGLSLFFQAALILLYMYPIICRSRLKKALKREPVKTREFILEFPGLFSDIKRSLAMTVTCVITDIVSSVLVWALTKLHPELFITILALHDINLVINIICAICTFRNWRKIIFGFPLLRRFVDTRDVSISYGKKISSTVELNLIGKHQKNSDLSPVI